MPPIARTGVVVSPQRTLQLIAETTRLMGVDFLPLGHPADEAEPPSPEVIVRASTVRAAPAAQSPAPPVAASPAPSRATAPEATEGAPMDDAPVTPAASDMHDAMQEVEVRGDLATLDRSNLPSREERASALAALRAEHDANCPHCTCATAHTQTVFGDGDPAAALMFVGEAPGAEEDRQGVPFVGASGKKLSEMIVAMGLSRERVYIANVLKARPPNNDTPTPEQVDRCGPYLARQIAIIRPAVIVTLGKPAVNYLVQTRESMTNLRGRWASYRGIPVMPTFHPAYLLRAYTPENRQKVWSDLKQVVTRLTELGLL